MQGIQPLSRQFHLAQQGLVAWIATEFLKQRVILQEREGALVALIGPIEPFKCVVSIAAIGVHLGNLVCIAIVEMDPRFDTLRTDPRYVAMMRRLNFPEEPIA